MTRTAAVVAILSALSLTSCAGAPALLAEEQRPPPERWDGYLLATPIGNYPLQVEIAGHEGRAEVWPPVTFEDVVRRGSVLALRMNTAFATLDLRGEVDGETAAGRWKTREGAEGAWRAWRRPSRAEDTPARRLDAVDRLLDLMAPLYPFWERKGVHAEALRGAWRRAVARTTTRESFLAEMARLLAALGDGHTLAVNNPRLQQLIKGRVRGATVDSAEGRYFLTEAVAEIAGRWPLPVDILTVDGEAVAERARRLQEEVPLHASSPQHLARVRCLYLLSGPADRPARLQGRSPGGRVVELEIARNGPRLPAVEAKRLAGGVGYLRLRRFDLEEGLLEAFDTALARLRDTPALILDLRNNGGGTMVVGLEVLGRFVRSAGTAATGAYRGAGALAASLPLPMGPSGPWQYAGALIVLANGGTYSTAEVVAAALRDAGRATLVGSRTGGGVSNKISVYLPAGVWVSFATLDGRRANGEPFEGRGIAPDVPLAVRADDLAAGSDRALEVGLVEARRRARASRHRAAR